MKIGPFDLRRRATAAAAPPAKRAPATVGASGTIDYDGFLQSDEYNPDLRGKEALDVFDKMLRSDGSVQEAVEHIFSPIKNATVTVEPPSNPTSDELVAAALVRDAFFETLNQPFVEYIDQALDYLAFGHQVFETSWQVVERELRYEVPGVFDTDPQGRRVPHEETVPKAQYLVWDRFEQRLQHTIFRWIQKGGKLQRIQQITWKDTSYEYPEIDAEQLLVLINKRRGDQFTGRSILRAAYKPWFMKEIVEKVEVVALERWGVGIIVAYLPESKKDDAALIARMEDICENLKAGESTYIIAPGPKQGSGPNGAEGYLFEIIGPQGTPPNFTDAKQYHRAEIKAAVLARFAELGHAQVGARSTGDTQSKVWYDALHGVARYLEDAHAPAIRRLVDANLTGVERYPTLAFSGIEARDLREFADSVSALVGSMAVKPDATFRDWVRGEIDAPPEDEIDDTLPPDPATPADPLLKRRNGAKPNPDQTALPVEAE